ncbi:hypothetical protein R3P38DRAFT_2982134, partial [Favolaschia claudopus]
MRFSSSSTLTAGGLLLLSTLVSAIPADSSASNMQTCLIGCSTTAFTATGCDFAAANSSACACASPVYASNFTQCGTSTCKASTKDINALLKTGCGDNAVVDNKNAASRLGVATASVFGLLSLSLAA